MLRAIVVILGLGRCRSVSNCCQAHNLDPSSINLPPSIVPLHDCDRIPRSVLFSNHCMEEASFRVYVLKSNPKP